MDSSGQKFCNYKFVSGAKKGQLCARFCRGGRDLCYTHMNQINKKQKKPTVSNEEETDQEYIQNNTPKTEPIKIQNAVEPTKSYKPQPQVENLKIDKPKKKIEVESSSISSSFSSSTDTSDLSSD